MTIKEVALQLGLKESTLRRNFPRTQETLRKKGIILMRWGYGKKAEYDIEYEEYLLEEDENEQEKLRQYEKTKKTL